jgi:predicted transcriptional regulator of viral defense system
MKTAATAWHELAGGRTLPKARVTVESPDYKTRLLAVVNKHPEGITLRDAADTLGVAPVVLGRVSKALLDKGEIRKEGKLYFPSAGK